MELPDFLAEIAARQLGLLTRRQLLEAGVPPGMIRWQTGRRWRSLLPGVILLEPGLPTHEQRLVAAVLAAGPHSWISGSTAAAFHGLDGSPPQLPVRVMVPFPGRSRRIGWVSVRATTLTNERLVHRGPLRVACRPRALVDAAAQAPDDAAARAMVIAAVQERRVRLDDVQHWVAVRRRNGTTRLKAAVRDAASGAWSLPEAELGRLVRSVSVLRGAWANPTLLDDHDRRLTTPDLWCDDVGLAMMVHSRRFHADVLDWEATVDSDEDLREVGIVVVGVTPSAIDRDPDTVVARLLAAHVRASHRPRPAVTALPRDVVGGIAL